MAKHSKRDSVESSQAEPANEQPREERLFVLFDYDCRELAATKVYPSYAEAAEDAAMLNNVIVVPLLLRHAHRAQSGVPPTHKNNANTEHRLPDVDLVLKAVSELGRKIHSLHECLTQRAKPLYTVAEVADLTGRSQYTVRRWIVDERIQAIRVAGTGPRGKLLIPSAELAKLIDAGRGGEMPAAVQPA